MIGQFCEISLFLGIDFPITLIAKILIVSFQIFNQKTFNAFVQGTHVFNRQLHFKKSFEAFFHVATTLTDYFVAHFTPEDLVQQILMR